MNPGLDDHPSLPGDPVDVSIIITTKNRSAELRRTIEVLRRLSPPPREILITADGCSDDTIQVVQAELPQARLFVNQQGRGSIASRDRMIREARGEFVLSLDDDSYPEQVDCLARIIPLFEQRLRMAVLHFPQRTDEYPPSLVRDDFGPALATRSFSSAGAVLRRSTYLQLRGFAPFFFHAYEEPDYALQCVAAGFDTYFSPSLTIRHHYTGTARNEKRTHHRHARNEFWSALIQVPFPYVIPVAAYRVFSQFRYACSRGLNWIVREPAWWPQALVGIPRCLRERQPVSWATYRAWLALPENGFTPEQKQAEAKPPLSAQELRS